MTPCDRSAKGVDARRQWRPSGNRNEFEFYLCLILQAEHLLSHHL